MNDGEESIDYFAIANTLRDAYNNKRQQDSGDDTGFIPVSELRTMINELNINMPEDVLEEAIMVGDVNEDGENISFYEFLGALLTDLDDEDEEGDLKRAFSLFQNGTTIAKSDLLNALRASGRSLNADQVEMLTHGYQTKVEGFLDFEEFTEVYNAAEDVL